MLKTREGFKYKLFLNLFNELDQLQMILTNNLQTYVLFQLANEQNHQHSIKTVLKNKKHYSTYCKTHNTEVQRFGVEGGPCPQRLPVLNQSFKEDKRWIY